MTDQPIHTHDCDVCLYLGTFEEHDLYTCPQGGRRTFIARHGSEGWEYWSGPAEIIDRWPDDHFQHSTMRAAREALKRWRERF